MILHEAIIEGDIEVVHGTDEGYFEYFIKVGIAATFEQLAELKHKFGFSFAGIKKANNWGTLLKFDCVITYIHFRVRPADEEKFLEFISLLKPVLYSTEFDFRYFIEPGKLPL